MRRSLLRTQVQLLWIAATALSVSAFSSLSQPKQRYSALTRHHDEAIFSSRRISTNSYANTSRRQRKKKRWNFHMQPNDDHYLKNDERKEGKVNDSSFAPKQCQHHPMAQMKHVGATAMLSIAILTTTLLLPQPAQAGFGPSGGATTSQAPMNAIKENAVESLSFDKLQQLIDSNMRGAGLSTLADQINALVDTLKLEEEQLEEEPQKFQLPKPDPASQKEYMSVQEYQDMERQRLENALRLQAQIVKRTAMLEKLEAQPAWFNYCAAFVGSVVSTSIMHPVDTIKTRLMMVTTTEDEDATIELEQVVNWNSTTLANWTDITVSSHHEDEDEDEDHDEKEARASSFSTKSNAMDWLQPYRHDETQTRTTVEQWKDTMANLYEGWAGNILKEGPPSALYLGVYEFVKLKLQLLTGITSTTASGSVGPLLLIYLAAGAAGETLGSTVRLFLGCFHILRMSMSVLQNAVTIYAILIISYYVSSNIILYCTQIRAPAEALKSLVQTGIEPTVPLAAQRVLGTPEGRANTFKAWSASICRDVPFGAIQLAIFELVKIAILNSSTIQWDAGTLQAEAIIGAFAGSIGAIVTTPADVLTTRIITQDTTTRSADDEESLGIVGMAHKVYQEEGAQAFFAGWEQRVLYWGPAISIFLTCYCSVRQLGIAYEWFG
jgi:hypothetical protein